MAGIEFMQILSLYDEAALDQALALLAADGVIAAPTDTVYGVMCRFDRPAAIEQLYEAKARPPQKAIPVLIADPAQLARLTSLPLSPLAQALTERFWPGALTLVLPALPHLPAILTAGQSTIGVRLPDHAGLRALIARSGPLAATSANLSGGPETHTAAEVAAQLDGRIPLILADVDAEAAAKTSQPPASTVVDLTQLDDGLPRILRAGALADAVLAVAAAVLTQSSNATR
jgi:L-threonylcarbamoyladenylate synthase